MLIKKRISITIGFLGIAILGISGAVIIPSLFAVRQLQKDIGAAHADLEARYSGGRQARTSAAALMANKDKFAELSRVAVKEGEELVFVNALEAAAPENTDMDILLETANQRSLSDWEREIPLKIKIRAPFSAVLSTMDAMERLPYSIVIQSIHAVGPGDKPRDEMTVDLAGTVYWQSNQAPSFLSTAISLAEPAAN